MDATLLFCKGIEYSARFLLARHLSDDAKARKLGLMELVILRLQARQAHAKVMDKRDELRALERSMKLAENAGVTVPLAELRVKKLRAERDRLEKELASVGGRMHTTLQLWQSSGATLEDLCNLCNRDPAQVRKEIDDTDQPLCDLAAVYNLDYKNPRDTGWLEDTVDAPMTHALKAFLLDTMLNTEAGRKAAHEAMMAVFPEIMENAYTEYTDPDGVRHLIDKDGVEVFTSDDE